MSVDSDLVIETLEEIELTGEQEGVQKIAGVIASHQSELTQKLHSYLSVLLKGLNGAAASSELIVPKTGRALLEQMIQFYNYVMSSSLLKIAFAELLEAFSDGSKQQPEMLERKEKVEEEQLSPHSKTRSAKEGGEKSTTPQEIFIRSLEKRRVIAILIEAFQKELEMLFSKVKGKQEKEQKELYELWRSVYEGEFSLTTVFESAQFLSKAPEQFPGISLEDDATIQLISQLTTDISEFILATRKALVKVLNITIETDPYYTSSAIVTQAAEIPVFFIEYLQNAIKNPIKFGVLNINAEIISKIIKDIRRQRSVVPRRRGEESEEEDEDDQESQIHFIKISNKTPAQPGVFFFGGERAGTFLLLPPDSVSYDIESKSASEAWQLIEKGSDIPKLQTVYDINSIFALLRQGPLVKLNTGLALNATLSQFFTVYPRIHDQVKPYFIIADVLGIIVATLEGSRAVLRPKEEPRLIFRISEATSEGLQIFVFVLGGIIEGFLVYHPKDAYISNQDFYTKFVSGPLILAAAYIALYSRPDVWDKCARKNKNLHYLKMSLHALASMLLFGSIFQNTLLTFFPKFTTSSTNSYFWSGFFMPLGASLAATTLRMGTRYGEFVRSIFSYLSLVNFAYVLYHQPITDKNEDNFAMISDLIRRILYPVVAGGSLIFIVVKAKGFLRDFYDRGELITRRIVLEEGSDPREFQLETRRHDWGKGLEPLSPPLLGDPESLVDSADQTDLSAQLERVKTEFDDLDGKEKKERRELGTGRGTVIGGSLILSEGGSRVAASSHPTPGSKPMPNPVSGEHSRKKKSPCGNCCAIV